MLNKNWLFDYLVDGCGFESVSMDGWTVSRTWTKDVEVAWHGTQTETFTVTVASCGDSAEAVFSRNGIPFKDKIYSYNGRKAFNAIRETIEYNGYSLEVA